MKKIVPNDAVLISDKARRVFKGIIYDVYQWPQTLFDGSVKTFEMLKRPDTVSVIGVTGDKILVIDDDQPHRGSRTGFPGGRVDESDSSPQAAAIREMLEETGYSFKSWRLIHVWQPHTKLEWFIYYYLALDGKKNDEPHLDSGEKIKVNLMSFEEVKHLAIHNSGDLRESKDLLEQIGSLEELVKLPVFQGKEADR